MLYIMLKNGYFSSVNIMEVRKWIVILFFYCPLKMKLIFIKKKFLPTSKHQGQIGSLFLDFQVPVLYIEY